MIPEVLRRSVWETNPNGPASSGYGPSNGLLLNWYLRVLREARQQHSSMTGQTNENEVPYLASDETRRWVVAIAGYALVLASLSNVHTYPSYAPDKPEYLASLEITLQKLAEIHQWMDDIIRRWRVSDTLPTWDMLQEVILRVSWMTTRDGEDVMKLVLQGDDKSRTYRDDMHTGTYQEHGDK